MGDLDLDLAHLNELRQECIKNLYSTAEYVKKYLDNNKDEKINILKKCLQDYIVSEAQQENDVEALNNLAEIDSSNVDKIEHTFSRMRENVEVNVDRDPRMCEFKRRIHLNGTTVSQTLNESDIIMTETNDTCTIDPITLKPIQDPMKNTKCGHLYERQAILKHITRNNRARCPVAGCRNQEPLQMENLVPLDDYTPQLYEDNPEDESNSELSQEY